MIVGKVVASLWASAQDPGFDARTLKVILPYDARSQETYGATLVAVDLVGSRTDDVVLVIYEGSASRMCMGSDSTCAEAIVVGIVDRMDVEA